MSLKVSYSNSGKGQQRSGAALKRKIVSRTLLPRSKTFRCFVLHVTGRLVSHLANRVKAIQRAFSKIFPF